MRDTKKDKSTSNASVIRVIKNKNYTTMSNLHLFHRELSLKAKGLMSICLALPDSWGYSVAGLMTLSGDGRDSVTSAIKTLQKYGFLTIEKERTEQGTFRSIYNFFENPDENPLFKSDSSITENPTRSNDHNGKTDSENPMQISRCSLSDSENLELLNTNNEILKSNTNNLILVNSTSEFTFDELKSLYDSICIHFPKIVKITDKRKQKANLRIKEYPKKDFWETVFQKAESSNFVRSNKFFCFDWVIKNNDNPLKVYEGNYDNKNQKVVDFPKSNNSSKYSECYK